MSITIKRIYEPCDKADGYRILVDRLWPRGIKKENAKIDTWLKEIGPSTDLRKWFDHQPDRWLPFVKKYHAELEKTDALETLRDLIRKHKKITLLYGSKEELYNQATALKEFLER